MLVLTRKKQQQVQIGDSITVTILSIRGNRVQVGVTAPDHVRVMRGELAPHARGPGASQGVTAAAVPSTPAPESSVTAPSAAARVGPSPTATGPTRAIGAETVPSEPGAAAQGSTARRSPLAKAVAQRSRAPLVRSPQRLGAASLGWLTAPRSRG
jgi:carbon storage regulator CsrA